MIFYLDIKLDADKRTLSAILVDNGYAVRKRTVKVGNRNKTFLEVSKEKDICEQKEN